MNLVTYEIEIAAPASVVYGLITTVEGLLTWMAVDATAEPVPGGTLRWTHENGATMSGHFVELVPPRRVVFAYGWEDGLMGIPPASTTVEIDLIEEAGTTTLHLSHRGIPPEHVEAHRDGWVFFLDRLQNTLREN